MIYANGFIFNVYNENFFEYLKRVVNNATYDMTDEVFDVLVNEMNENFIEYIVNWLYSDMFIRSSWGQDHKAKLLKKCKCCFECFLERCVINNVKLLRRINFIFNLYYRLKINLCKT